MGLGRGIVLAMRRARWGVLSVGLAYLASVLVGVGMATAHAPVALERRDALVAAAQEDPSSWRYDAAIVSGPRCWTSVATYSPA